MASHFRTGVCAFLLLLASCAMSAERLGPPRILDGDWPRTLFFRISEGVAANRGYSHEVYNGVFSRLDGIIGKALDEEIPGRSTTNIDYFREFKLAHPSQMVLLHFNGDARDPRFQTDDYFAGHWIYYSGCKITKDITASQTVIPVEDASLFRTHVGRYGDRNEDIGLCELDPGGRPNWHKAEQVKLLSVDTSANTISVERGAFGTAARPFRANASYAASHAYEGPWGADNNLLWCYNFARGAPTDARGLSGGDILVQEFVNWFAPQGELSYVDGVEFDVMYYYRWGEYDPSRGRRGPDVDADGHADWGFVDGTNVYGIGVIDWHLGRDAEGGRTQTQVAGTPARSYPVMGERASRLAQWRRLGYRYPASIQVPIRNRDHRGTEPAA